MTVFNPTIEVVTFRLRGWCMLAAFVVVVVVVVVVCLFVVVVVVFA